MDDHFDILAEYIKMREGNNLREQADLSLIKQLKKELDEARAESAELKIENKRYLRQIELMQSAQPVTNNFNVDGDLIQHQHVGAIVKNVEKGGIGVQTTEK